MKYPSATQMTTPNAYTKDVAPVELVVIHYTAAGSASGSAKWLCDPQAKASAHFVIERDGRVWQLADTDHRTWHAGGPSSSWNGRRVNSRSIGIELANWGPIDALRMQVHTGAPYKGPPPFIDVDGKAWEPYPPAQLQAAENIVRWLAGLYPTLRAPSPGPLPRLVGHQDVDPSRKRDPGPAFDRLGAARRWLT
jgi:N-acetylmuramoyl-L-alanine amidase